MQQTTCIVATETVPYSLTETPNRKETRMFDPNTESLKQNIARMEAELAEMKDTLSKRERNWPNEITKGMLFRHKYGGVYMTVRIDRYGNLVLARMEKGDEGNSWSYGECFNVAESQFTYIGLAADHLRIV